MVTVTESPSTTSAQAVTWDDVISWMHHDAREYGIAYLIPWMDNVLWCEGRGNPYAVGGAGEIGPAQFHPAGVWSDVPRWIFRSWWDVYDIRRNVLGFVWAFANGLSFHWTCA